MTRSRSMMGWRPLVMTGLILFLFSPEAEAVPAFARKYATSCQTCHTAYPKLNSFGRAFRLLGYHMPGETEDQIKQPDVALGSEAYKRVWPKAVWPGRIPAQIPVSMTAQFLTEYSTHFEDGDLERVKNDFIFPSEVALIAGGSAGDNISFFGEIAFEQEVEHGEKNSEAAVEHIDLRFVRLINDSPVFNVKVGSFQPELVETFDHARRLTISNYDAMFAVQTVALGGAAEVGGGHHGGGAGLAIPAVAEGFELYGVARHRLLWAAGVVNGIGPGEETFDANSAKDVYGRIAYKWGGLSPDGSNLETYAGSSKNWRERSLQLEAFFYRGDGSDILVAIEEEEEHGEAGEEPEAHNLARPASLVLDAGQMPEALHSEPAFLEDDDFQRIGLGINYFYDDLNVFGAFVEGEDDLNVFAPAHDDPHLPGRLLPGESGEFTYRAWFLEADMVLGYPWLHVATRYETVDFPSHGTEDFDRATVSVTALVRANVKATLEYLWDLNQSDNRTTWLNFGVAF